VVDGDKLAELDELLKANLGDSEVSRTRKRKRHTSIVEEQASLIETSEPALFRLLSVARPPKLISLEPKPLPPRTVWEPPCEDNDREAEVRKQQALSAAIDIKTLFKSAQAYITRPPKPEKIISASADLDVPLASLPIFLAEMPHSIPRLSGASHNRATRPSPHEVTLKGDGLPVVSLNLRSNEQPAAHRKRKRRRRLVKRPPAMF